MTLFVATHSKLRKAVDGTGTQVTTCMINKWMAKISGKEIYNTRDPPKEGGKKKEKRKKRREIKRKTVTVLTTPESFHS